MVVHLCRPTCHDHTHTPFLRDDPRMVPGRQGPEIGKLKQNSWVGHHTGPGEGRSRLKGS